MKFLIMHGSYGSPEENWFRWLEKSLKNEGHEVILEQFPVDDWDEVTNITPAKISEFTPKQNLTTWEKFFVANIIPKIGDEPFYFIGHSSAPIFMLHMLEKYDFKLAGAIFVSPFFNIPDRPAIWQFYPANKTFYSYDFDFAKIKSQILGKTYVVYGDNDPYVPQSEPPLFANKLGSELIMVPNGGHCGSIFKEFPLILSLLKK
jgi:predicted alpha/beta hydrolase family esterase